MGNINPFHLATVLETALSNLGLTEHYWRQRAVHRWPQIVGPEIAAHTRAAGWVNDHLLIEVDEPVWAQQCSLLSNQLVEKINKALGRQVVTGLKFKIRGRPLHNSRISNQPLNSDKQLLPSRFESWLRVVDKINDPVLAATMKRWLVSCLQKTTQSASRECPGCGAPFNCQSDDDAVLENTAVYCLVCRLEWRRGGIRQHIKSLLREEPWLSYAQLRERLGEVDERLFRDVKNRLLTEWRSCIRGWTEKFVYNRRPIPDKLRGTIVDTLARYVCLETGRRPDELELRQTSDVSPLMDKLLERGKN